MARIANFTSAGVPTAAAGLTLSELMARQKELADRQATLAGPSAGSTTIAGGLGQMVNALFTGIEERKVAQQEAEGRQHLADIIGGINWDSGPTGQQIAQTSMLDPEQARFLTQQMIEATRARREREQQLADTASAQAFRTSERQATEQFQTGLEETKLKAAQLPKISDISGVRQDVISDPSYKNMAQAVPIWSSMQDAATRDSTQADLNMVVALAKLFDPTSVVRQSESGAVELTGDYPTQLAGYFKYLTATPGSRLNDKMRQGMLEEGWSRVKGYADAYQKTSDFYSNLATESGIPTDRVVPSFGDLKPYVRPAEPAPGATPPAGPDERGAPATDIPPNPDPAKYTDEIWQRVFPTLSPESQQYYRSKGRPQQP